MCKVGGVMLLTGGVLLLSGAGACLGGIVEQIGSHTDWPTSWTLIRGLDDPDDGLADEQLDFVGNTADAGAFWAVTDTYLYFRMRVDVGQVTDTTFHDSHFVLIDNTPGDARRPDYGIAWDSKSNDPTHHGLEMTVRGEAEDCWNDMRMTDLDGDSGAKGVEDINGDGRTSDGYVRTIDGQVTGAFGTTTFIDYAVSWDYLRTYTTLDTNQTWLVQFASVADANDSKKLGADIAGCCGPCSEVALSMVAIPEPLTAAAVIVGGLCLGLLLRRTAAPRAA